MNDLTFAELQKQILSPWHQGQQFAVSGKVVPDRDSVEEIRVTHTTESQNVLAERYNKRQGSAGWVDFATDRRLLPIWHGTDHTNELLFASLAGAPLEPDLGLILALCKRLPRAAQILAVRDRGKAPFLIQDEYDVQDLLHAILRAYLKYTIHEEPLGKVAGVKSGRVDVAIEDLGIIIEVKFIRGPKDDQRLLEEFAEDILLYAKWPPLKHFVYLCYNSDDLRDPEALEKLGGEHTVAGVPFTAHIVLA